MPCLSWRTEPRYLLGPTVMAKLAEEGASWLVHIREVTASAAPGREMGMPTVNWMEPDYSTGRWRKAWELRAINKASWTLALFSNKDIFAEPWAGGRGGWLQDRAAGEDQQGLPEYPSDIAETGLVNWKLSKLTWAHHHDQMTNEPTGWGLRWANHHFS